jgi:hypothetical protein
VNGLRTVVLAFAATAVAMSVAGCGERPQVINYKQGKYQGKPDTPAFNSPPFNGNKQQWENEIDDRAQKQNEYVRLRD